MKQILDILDAETLAKFKFHEIDDVLDAAVRAAYRKHIEQGQDGQAVLALGFVPAASDALPLYFISDPTESEQFQTVRRWCEELRFNEPKTYRQITTSPHAFSYMLACARLWTGEHDDVIDGSESPVLVEWMLQQKGSV